VSDSDSTRQLEEIVRHVSSAAKSLQLYPPSSPIPRQSVEAAVAALDTYFQSNQLLSLRVGRNGFERAGVQLSANSVTSSDLAALLREHGIAELDLLPGCTADELATFLATVMQPPGEIRARGGVATVLVTSGVESVRVTDVHLTVIEETTVEPEGDLDEFLRALATDPDKLAAWMAAASAGDPAAFAEGLEELVACCGPDGFGELAATLSRAFMEQASDGKDALLGLAMQPGTVQELTRGMFSHLSESDIAGAVAEGLFGSNMLSLSNALVHLPLDNRLGGVHAEVQDRLPDLGHGEKEIDFLEHMIDVRNRTEPEPSLVDADERYRRAAQTMQLSAEEVSSARQRTAEESATTEAAGVRTMLSLLDQQTDFELYCQTLDNLAGMVPRLFKSGDVELAHRIVTEIAVRKAKGDQPWPDLAGRLEAALAAALSEPTMRVLVDTLVEHPALAAEAHELLRHAPEPAVQALVSQAVAHKEDGIAVAEQLLGRRVLDHLASLSATAQWYQLGPVVQRLAREADPRYVQVVQSALKRDEEQARREAAAGVAASGSPDSARLLADLVRDDSAEVAIVAIRALAKHRVDGGAKLLATRLAEIDADGKDFATAREIIGALARMSDPAAVDALRRLSNRKALIKRGHFAEVQELVRQALNVQASQGGAM